MKGATICLAVLALSMPLVTPAVKAQDKALPSTNNESLKDSVKSKEGEISKLVQTLMASGGDWKYVNGHAQAVGLEGPMPVKATAVPVGDEARKCQIIYEPDEINGNRPFCVYFLRTKKTKKDIVERFYRVSLDGQLEKVVTLGSKLDGQGKTIRAERSRVEEDMTSPEIQKAFKAEMTFWLKEWLKKQQKLDAKKTTAAAKNAPPAQPTP